MEEDLPDDLPLKYLPPERLKRLNLLLNPHTPLYNHRSLAHELQIPLDDINYAGSDNTPAALYILKVFQNRDGTLSTLKNALTKLKRLDALDVVKGPDVLREMNEVRRLNAGANGNGATNDRPNRVPMQAADPVGFDPPVGNRPAARNGELGQAVLNNRDDRQLLNINLLKGTIIINQGAGAPVVSVNGENAAKKIDSDDENTVPGNDGTANGASPGKNRQKTGRDRNRQKGSNGTGHGEDYQQQNGSGYTASRSHCKCCCRPTEVGLADPQVSGVQNGARPKTKPRERSESGGNHARLAEQVNCVCNGAGPNTRPRERSENGQGKGSRQAAWGPSQPHDNGTANGTSPGAGREKQSIGQTEQSIPHVHYSRQGSVDQNTDRVYFHDRPNATTNQCSHCKAGPSPRGSPPDLPNRDRRVSGQSSGGATPTDVSNVPPFRRQGSHTSLRSNSSTGSMEIPLPKNFSLSRHSGTDEECDPQSSLHSSGISLSIIEKLQSSQPASSTQCTRCRKTFPPKIERQYSEHACASPSTPPIGRLDVHEVQKSSAGIRRRNKSEGCPKDGFRKGPVLLLAAKSVFKDKKRFGMFMETVGRIKELRSDEDHPVVMGVWIKSQFIYAGHLQEEIEMVLLNCSLIVIFVDHMYTEVMEETENHPERPVKLKKDSCNVHYVYRKIRQNDADFLGKILIVKHDEVAGERIPGWLAMAYMVPWRDAETLVNDMMPLFSNQATLVQRAI